MPQTIVLSFLAGAMAANVIPHFVKGITREPYPNVISSSPVVNLAVGWLGLLVAGLLAYWAQPDRFPAAAVAAGAIGVLPMGLFHAAGGAYALSDRSSRGRGIPRH